MPSQVVYPRFESLRDFPHFLDNLFAEIGDAFAPSEEEGAELLKETRRMMLLSAFVAEVISVSGSQQEAQVAGFLLMKSDQAVQT